MMAEHKQAEIIAPDDYFKGAWCPMEHVAFDVGKMGTPGAAMLLPADVGAPPGATLIAGGDSESGMMPLPPWAFQPGAHVQVVCVPVPGTSQSSAASAELLASASWVGGPPCHPESSPILLAAEYADSFGLLAQGVQHMDHMDGSAIDTCGTAQAMSQWQQQQQYGDGSYGQLAQDAYGDASYVQEPSDFAAGFAAGLAAKHLEPQVLAPELPPLKHAIPSGPRVFIHDSSTGLRPCNNGENLTTAAEDAAPLAVPHDAKIFMHDSTGELKHIAQYNDRNAGTTEINVLQSKDQQPREKSRERSEAPKQSSLREKSRERGVRRVRWSLPRAPSTSPPPPPPTTRRTSRMVAASAVASVAASPLPKVLTAAVVKANLCPSPDSASTATGSAEGSEEGGSTSDETPRFALGGLLLQKDVSSLPRSVQQRPPVSQLRLLPPPPRVSPPPVPRSPVSNTKLASHVENVVAERLQRRIAKTKKRCRELERLEERTSRGEVLNAEERSKVTRFGGVALLQAKASRLEGRLARVADGYAVSDSSSNDECQALAHCKVRAGDARVVQELERAATARDEDSPPNASPEGSVMEDDVEKAEQSSALQFGRYTSLAQAVLQKAYVAIDRSCGTNASRGPRPEPKLAPRVARMEKKMQKEASRQRQAALARPGGNVAGSSAEGGLDDRSSQACSAASFFFLVGGAIGSTATIVRDTGCEFVGAAAEIWNELAERAEWAGRRASRGLRAASKSPMIMLASGVVVSIGISVLLSGRAGSHSTNGASRGGDRLNMEGNRGYAWATVAPSQAKTMKSQKVRAMVRSLEIESARAMSVSKQAQERWENIVKAVEGSDSYEEMFVKALYGPAYNEERLAEMRAETVAAYELEEGHRDSRFPRVSDYSSSSRSSSRESVYTEDM